MSDIKNDLPVNQQPSKADNDMESSDLNFSEERPEIDRNAYEIENIGNFEVDNSSEEGL